MVVVAHSATGCVPLKVVTFEVQVERLHIYSARHKSKSKKIETYIQIPS